MLKGSTNSRKALFRLGALLSKYGVCMVLKKIMRALLLAFFSFFCYYRYFFSNCFWIILLSLKIMKKIVSHLVYTFRYAHWNKRLPLISASSLISASHLNTVFIRTVTIFYWKLNQIAHGTSMKTIKQLKYDN